MRAAARGVALVSKRHSNHTNSLVAACHVERPSGININSVIELSRVDDFTHTFDVNVFGVLRVTKAFLGAVRRARGRTLWPRPLQRGGDPDG